MSPTATYDIEEASYRNDLLIEHGELTIPTRPEAMFGRRGPFCVEIGFGAGGFLTRLAGLRPGWKILGVELSPPCHSRARKSLIEAGHANVRLLKAPGEFVIRNITPAESIRRVYVNFPDPWPKERHHDRRLLQRQFFEVLAGRLEEHGELWLTSDHAEYFDWAVACGEATDLYDICRRKPDEALLQTKYGRKWRQEGKQIQQAVFAKAEEGDWIPPDIELVDEMHHATIRGELPDPEDFQKIRSIDDDRVIIILEAYRNVGGEGLLFLAHIEESDLTQRVLIDVTPREEVGDGDRKIVVGIRRFNQPLMTKGTGAAVECVAQWVVDQAEGNRIVERRF